MRVKRKHPTANEIYRDAPVVNEILAHDCGFTPYALGVLDECDDGLDRNTKVVFKEHYDPYIDGYRCMTLFSVWFEDKPFMLCQRAGRSGTDHREEWITDVDVLRQADAYLHSLLTLEDLDVVSPDDENIEYVFFYGTLINEDFSDGMKVEYEKPTQEEVSEYVTMVEVEPAIFDLLLPELKAPEHSLITAEEAFGFALKDFQENNRNPLPRFHLFIFLLDGAVEHRSLDGTVLERRWE